MRIIATLTEAAAKRRYLEGVGLPAEPPLVPARPTPQQSLDFAGTTAICAKKSLLRPYYRISSPCIHDP